MSGFLDALDPPDKKYPWVYGWGAGPFGPNPVRAGQKGKRCRILVQGTKNSALLEFQDGFKLISSVRALRGFERRAR